MTEHEPLTGAHISADVKEARRTSFGAEADVYDRVRPEWPLETVSWLVGDPPDPLDVLDLGCGTGKGTRTLADAGHRVIAVDPSDGMLDVLRASLSEGQRVQVLRGGAEELPLEDGSVDAIVCLQAWHWVKPETAGPECARVLRPGGLLGLGWHKLDDSADWVRELAQRSGRPEAMTSRIEPEEFTVPGFGPVKQRTFHYDQPMSVDDLVLQVSSWSHVAISPQRDAWLAAVRDLGEQVAENGVVTVPHVTEVGRARVVA